jgi:hypothetical protein
MFPQDLFQEFAKYAGNLFPEILSDKNQNDPLQRRDHFQRAWLAVCYRYHACFEHNVAFKAMLADTSDLWREWGADEEQNYRVEQCLYHFFVNGLSVFESLGFCLYFVAAMIDPNSFPYVNDPRKITLKNTVSALETHFPGSAVARNFRELLNDATFTQVDDIRNILVHRLTGRRHIRSYDNADLSGEYAHRREEFWHLPGSDKELVFDEGLIQRYFDEITRLLTALIQAALEFVKTRTGSTT